MRKMLNRESRERTRKEDKEFEQNKTVVGRGKAILAGSNIVIPMPFVAKNNRIKPQKAQKTQK